MWQNFARAVPLSGLVKFIANNANNQSIKNWLHRATLNWQCKSYWYNIKFITGL